MANIDDELQFLRDANDSDAILSRAAISEALRIINEDRAYPPRTLSVTENGEYETDSEHPYDKVDVKVNDDAISALQAAPSFIIKENGLYNAKDLFGKTMLITEFEVDVNNMTDKLPNELSVNRSGEYTALDDEYYSKVIVNIPSGGHPGELLTAEFYFFDPSDPNDMSLVYICKEEGILFGQTALNFISRFPRFKNIKVNSELYYAHENWNPDPTVLKNDQRFIPVWNKYTSEPTSSKTVDVDIFIYIAQNNLINYFYDEEDEIDVIDPNTHDQLCTLYYYGDGITDADGHKTNSCFAVETRKYISGNIYQPRFCDPTDISDINTRTPVDGDKYYWWGCSLIRAFIQHDRTLLRRQDDLDKYDEYESLGYTINSLLPNDILSSIVPISHYVTHPERVSTNYKYYSKTVPRDKITYRVEHNTYYKVDNANIPIDPNTGQQSPRYAGLYEARYDRSGHYQNMVLTTDTTIVSGKNYYDTRDGYEISVDSPYVSDIYPERTGDDRNTWNYQTTGWSDEDKNLRHSGVLYVDDLGSNNYKAYKKINDSLVEYTGQNQFDYVYLHMFQYLYDKDAYRATEMYALCDAIQDREELEEWPDIDMSMVFTIREGAQIYHYYFYRTEYPMTIYSFKPGSSTGIARFCENDASPEVFNNIYQKYLQNDIYKTLMSNSAIDEHEYLPTGDILSTETYRQYAEGMFRESDVTHNTYWYYTVNSFISYIQNFIFYNYYEISNNMNTPPVPYHFERYFDSNSQKYDYKIVKGNPTEFTGYDTANVTLQVRNTSEKVIDKFLVSKTCNIKPINYDNAFNNLNIALMTNIENVESLPYNTICATSYLGIRGGRGQESSEVIPNGVNTDRNINRYIYADKKTIEYFQDATDKYYDRPDLYEMPTLEDTQTVWQDFYDNFDTYAAERYDMNWPYDLTSSYPPTKYPIYYEKLYFFI